MASNRSPTKTTKRLTNTSIRFDLELWLRCFDYYSCWCWCHYVPYDWCVMALLWQWTWTLFDQIKRNEFIKWTIVTVTMRIVSAAVLMATTERHNHRIMHTLAVAYIWCKSPFQVVRSMRPNLDWIFTKSSSLSQQWVQEASSHYQWQSPNSSNTNGIMSPETRNVNELLRFLDRWKKSNGRMSLFWEFQSQSQSSTDWKFCLLGQMVRNAQ